MATMIKCDRCGAEEETKGTGVVQGGPGILAGVPAFRKTALPDDWRRVPMPQRDGSAWDKELCPPCVNALYAFMEGDGAVPGLLEPVTLEEIQAATTERGCVAHGGPDCTCDDRDDFDGVIETRKRCTCAGVGFGTEDCVLHHPDGLEKGTHLKCYRNETGDTAGECPGIYRRGMFAEHMERWHGLKVAEGSKACPYCATIESGIWELGQHIAAEHPGDWHAWVDGGQHAG